MKRDPNAPQAKSGGTMKCREDVDYIKRGLLRELEVLLDELLDEVYGPVQPVPETAPRRKPGQVKVQTTHLPFNREQRFK